MPGSWPFRMPQPGRTLTPAPRRRLLAAAALLAAALAAAAAFAHAWLNRPSELRRLRGAAARALVERLPAARLGDQARVDWLGRLVVGPLELPGRRPGETPPLRAAEVAVAPRWLPLLAGRVEPGAVTLRGLRVDPSRGDELGALASGMGERARSPENRGQRPATPGERLELRLEDARVALPGGGEAGPYAGRLRATSGPEASLRGELRLPGGGSAELRAARAGDGAEVLAEVEARASDLPAPWLAGLPFEIRGGRIRARLEGRASPDLRSGSGRLTAELAGLVLEGERIAREPVGPVAVALEGPLRWDADRRVALERASLSLGSRTSIAVSAALGLGAEPRFSLEARADRLDVRAALAALPRSFRPEEGPPLAGALTARISLEGPAGRPAEWQIAGDLDLGDLRRAARAAGPSPLEASFRYRPPGADGRRRAIVVGPESPSFVAVAGLPAHVVRAVTTAEDAGFFAHRGFDFEEIRNALAAGAGNGRLRGASTITQQVAKNLFLSPERRLARKVREALLTLALEASLPKARILEIYLNIAEWGPGLFGIGEAARHYFGKEARALTPREAAFLAAVIPSPSRVHAQAAAGELPEPFREKIDLLLYKMRQAGQLSDSELQEALEQPLAFAGG